MSTLTLPSTAECDPATRVTRSLLGYGVLAGPFYVVVSLAQALTRDGFDLTRHEWSLLANGDHGWIQITNLVLTGLMVIAAAAGLGRLDGGWAPRLIGLYGVGLVAAGTLTADPALGFPAGTPDAPAQVSWHGLGHLVAAGIGFLGLIAACLVTARRQRARGRTRMAAFSAFTGVAFLAAFATIAATGGGTGPTLILTAGVVLSWAWLSVHSLVSYRAA